MAINYILLTRRWLQASAGPPSAVLHLDSVISWPIVFLYYSARSSAFGRDLGSAMALGCNDGTPIAPYTAKGGSLPRPSHSVSGLADTFKHFVSIVSAAQSVGHGGSAEANAKGVRFPLLPSLTRCYFGMEPLEAYGNCSFYVMSTDRTNQDAPSAWWTIRLLTNWPCLADISLDGSHREIV